MFYITYEESHKAKIWRKPLETNRKSQQEKYDLSLITIRNWILPTIWMGLDEDPKWNSAPDGTLIFIFKGPKRSPNDVILGTSDLQKLLYNNFPYLNLIIML